MYPLRIVFVGLSVVALAMSGGCGGDAEPDSTAAATTGPPTTDVPADPPTTPVPTTGAPTTGAPTTEVPDGGSPAPEVVTELDDGSLYTLGTDQTAALRLTTEDWSWSTPTADGGSIELVPVDYLVDPGFTEWSVEPRSPGETTVTIAGEQVCDDDAGCSTRTVTITFRVGG